MAPDIKNPLSQPPTPPRKLTSYRSWLQRAWRSETARNSTFNMLGLGLPLIVAVIAIPMLVRTLGVEQFGILTIIWAVVSYFGLFDLGLGRALTLQIATNLAEDNVPQLMAMAGTALAMMFALGTLAGGIMALGGSWLARELAATDQAEVTRAFYWMAAAMPAVVLTSGYRGILEAFGRFGLVNAIRLPMGLMTYAGPLAAVWFGGGLEAISAVLCVGRIFAAAIHCYLSMAILPAHGGSLSIQRRLIGPLATMGGWMTITNVVSPIMNYTDRFVIGIATNAQAVAYYATPQELVLRIGIIPTAVTAVLFPKFSSQSMAATDDNLERYLWRYTLVVLALLAPLTIALVIGGGPLLAAWISADFASEATGVLQIMALAALCSGLAQTPFTMLQSRGRADQTAKLHLIQLPIYLALLSVLVLYLGVIGAALAWFSRIFFDMLAMFFLCLRDLRRSAQAGGPLCCNLTGQ